MVEKKLKSKPQKGINKNVEYNGNLYHVQTEVLGIFNNSPELKQIMTQVFSYDKGVAGTVLYSEKVSYKDIYPDAEMSMCQPVMEKIGERKENQFDEVIRKLKTGILDSHLSKYTNNKNGVSAKEDDTNTKSIFYKGEGYSITTSLSLEKRIIKCKLTKEDGEAKEFGKPLKYDSSKFRQVAEWDVLDYHNSIVSKIESKLKKSPNGIEITKPVEKTMPVSLEQKISEYEEDEEIVEDEEIAIDAETMKEIELYMSQKKSNQIQAPAENVCNSETSEDEVVLDALLDETKARY